MEPTLLGFTWRHSRRQQLVILALTIASFPLVYISLEIPKTIINKAIEGSTFPVAVLGVEMGQITYLWALCVLFLLLIIVINGLKWLINVAVGMVGERMLRRLRYVLFTHVMRFRISRFRSTQPGEIIQSMLGEIEPLGGFIGEMIATPVYQGGLLAVYVVFIFVQDPWLGLASVALYPFQALIIPRLQAKVIRLNRERARNTRKLADWINESVANIADIHTNDAARWHLSQVSQRLHSNTVIRRDLFERKFTIKFINNFLNQLPPFFFYAVGGSLVIAGRLDFGALVAVLAAYRDVASPWKELLNFSQSWTDYSGRYEFVVENFVGQDVHDDTRLHGTDAPVLAGDMVLRDVTGGPGTGGLAVGRLVLRAGAAVAITGGEQGARESLLRLMAGLALPASGDVTVAGQPLGDATLPQLGRAVAYIGREPGMFSGTLRQNLLYGLLRADPPPAGDGGPAALFLREAVLTGNSTTDPDGDWTDYAAAGVADAAGLEARLHHLVQRFGLESDIIAAALAAPVPPDTADSWTVAIRAAQQRFARIAPDLQELVEAWDPARYNTNASLLTNLLYAAPVTAGDDLGSGTGAKTVMALLEDSGGAALLDEIGLDLAREFAAVVDAMGANSPVLDRFAGYTRQDITEGAALAADARSRARQMKDRKAKARLRGLAARFVERRDQFDLLTPARKARILAARASARSRAAAHPDLLALDSDRFNPGRTLLANILHAPRRLERRAAWKRIDDAVAEAVAAEQLGPALLTLGLGQPLAAAGLSAAALRQIALLRAVLKRPAFLLLDGPAAGEAAEDRALRAAIRAELPAVTLVYAASSAPASDAGVRHLHIAASGMLSEGGEP